MKKIFARKAITKASEKTLVNYYKGYFKIKHDGVATWSYLRSGCNTSVDIFIPSLKSEFLDNYALTKFRTEFVDSIVTHVLGDREFNKIYTAVIEAHDYEILNPEIFSVDENGVVRYNEEKYDYVDEDDGSFTLIPKNVEDEES